MDGVRSEFFNIAVCLNHMSRMAMAALLAVSREGQSAEMLP